MDTRVKHEYDEEEKQHEYDRKEKLHKYDKIKELEYDIKEKARI